MSYAKERVVAFLYYSVYCHAWEMMPCSPTMLDVNGPEHKDVHGKFFPHGIVKRSDLRGME